MALQLMKIGGVEGLMKVESAGALDLVRTIASGLDWTLIDEKSIELRGDARCAGIFSNGTQAVTPNASMTPTPADLTSWFPEDGIVISSGNAGNITSNDNGSQKTCFNTTGDAVLDNIVQGLEVATTNVVTLDACVLSFSFTAPRDADELYFEYVFGSDEYEEFVGDVYNDYFALVLNGENIAVVPGTVDTQVAINTMNQLTNKEYYISNDPGNNTDHNDPIPYPHFAPDGFTKKLIASGGLNVGTTNTLSFNIADVWDCSFDSWVLIEAGSLTFNRITMPPTTSPPTVSHSDVPTVSRTPAPRPPTVSRTPAPIVSRTPAPTGVEGDPHFRTWSGAAYDFHGVCDLVLIHSAGFGKGIGMDVHIRTERMKMWSYVASAVIRIGQDMFEVMGGNEVKVWTNGVEGELQNTEGEKDGSYHVSTISGHPIYMTRESEKQDEFVIDLGNGEEIVIGTWHSFVRVSFKNAKKENFKDSRGLMGSFPAGVKLARDSSTKVEDVNTFGQEWQVLDSEPNLFHNIKSPQHPLKCEIPSHVEMRRRLGESKITTNQAEKACANVNEAERDLCIFDVMATNDEITAGAY